MVISIHEGNPSHSTKPNDNLRKETTNHFVDRPFHGQPHIRTNTQQQNLIQRWKNQERAAKNKVKAGEQFEHTTQTSLVHTVVSNPVALSTKCQIQQYCAILIQLYQI